jgi:hypothetical protein
VIRRIECKRERSDKTIRRNNFGGKSEENDSEA